MNEYYLAHGGPGSGRYPLGSGERPYQKFEGSRRKRSGGIIGYIQSRREKRQENKSANKIQEKSSNAQKTENQPDRETVLRKGTATEILNRPGEFSNDELEKAVRRIELESQLKTFSEKEKKSALKTLKNVQAYTNVSSALAKDGIELWNSFAAIFNVTENGKKDPLPLISKGGGGDGKKKK